MKRIFFASMTLIIASFFMACEPAANTGNKPANAPANNANAAAPVANAAAIETEIKKSVTELAALVAKNDAAGLEKVYSNNYMLVNTDGSVQTGAERLASFRSGETKFDSFAYDEINVRSNTEGTGAVVIMRATAAGTNRGKPVVSPIRVTQVWSKTKDGWKMVSGQATPIAAAAAPAKTDDKAKDAAPKPAANK